MVTFSAVTFSGRRAEEGSGVSMGTDWATLTRPTAGPGRPPETRTPRSALCIGVSLPAADCHLAYTPLSPPHNPL